MALDVLGKVRGIDCQVFKKQGSGLTLASFIHKDGSSALGASPVKQGTVVGLTFEAMLLTGRCCMRCSVQVWDFGPFHWFS